MRHETVVHMLRWAAQTNPNALALVYGSDSLTYADYLACVSRFAHELISLGIDNNDCRVCLIMANCLDMAIAVFGVQAAGAQIVPLNPAYTVSELEPILNDADPRLILVGDDIASPLETVFDKLSNCTVVRIGARTRRLAVRRDAGADSAKLPLPKPFGISAIQYTGGTTGRSKGVMLSHAAVVTNIAQREALLPTEPGDRVLIMTPLFHVYAIAMGLYLAANCGGTLYILPRYKPSLLLEAIERQKITVLAATPTIYTGLLASEELAGADCSSLRICCSGSSALPAAILQQWEAITGCPICEGYGQTEAGPILTHNPRYGLRKPGSVGVALPATNIEIVDPAEGNVRLPTGAIGEIRAHGPQLMSGYRNLPELSAETLREGWLYTGDLGELDGDGYLFVRGRKKDMVIVSGYNVYPREVEEVLYRFPGIRDAAVIGVTDSYRGEKLVGCLVGSRVTDEELHGFLAQHLTRYKIPEEFCFLENLPRTPAGKIDKRALVDAYGSMSANINKAAP